MEKMNFLFVLICLAVAISEVTSLGPCRCGQGSIKPMPPECVVPADCPDPNAVCETGMCVCKPNFTDVTGVCSGECANDCVGRVNGDYQSCQGCRVFLTCSNGIATDNRPCPANLVWDDNLKQCDFTSTTCFEPTVSRDLLDGPYK